MVPRTRTQMLTRRLTLLTFLLAGAWLASAATLAAEAPASAPSAAPAPSSGKSAQASEPDHVVVQHVLIGFQGSVPHKNITRSKDDAKKLADEVLQRARKGEDFGALVKQYTDDAPPGIYGMSNNGVAPGSAETKRAGMVKGFGDVSFSLKVGEFGVASYDPQVSPF